MLGDTFARLERTVLYRMVNSARSKHPIRRLGRYCSQRFGWRLPESLLFPHRPPWGTMRLRVTPSDTTKPIGSDEWTALCSPPLTPVRTLSSPVARAVAELTQEGDILLEAGCGSAALSAELATIARVIELGDFSQPILERATRLFQMSGLPSPRTTLCDLTQPLPWANDSVDVVWSSGVLEHWTDDELVPIVSEMRRIARKCVISLVPYSGCVFYRLGKYLAEQTGHWPFGREIPRQTLSPVFRKAGLSDIREFTLWNEWGPRLLGLTNHRLARAVEQWWDSLPSDDPVKHDQGYVLLTVGYN